MDLSCDKVKDLFDKYAKKTGMKPEELQFVYSGKPLYDKKELLLAAVGITNNSTVLVIGRLLGGKTIKLIIVGLNKQEYNLQIDDGLTGYALKQQFYILNQSLTIERMAFKLGDIEI
jgi:hypothetical protein